MRNSDITMAGKSYGWDSKTAMDEVAAKLRKAKPAAKADNPKASKKTAKKSGKSKKAGKAKTGNTDARMAA